MRAYHHRGFKVMGLATVLLLLAIPSLAQTVIDPPLPLTSTSPWHSFVGQSVITYSFDDSWNGITWAEADKTAIRSAIVYLDSALPDQTFVETGGSDITARWGGSDFFKDWRDATYTDAGWDISDAIAVANKHGGPWDEKKYPTGEMYVNTKYSFSSGEQVDPDKYDLVTVTLHELIHLLACDNHAGHEEEVMYPSLKKGERKTLQDSDLDILLNAGYRVATPAPLVIIPEPNALAWLFVYALSGTGFLVRRHHRRR